MAVPKRRKSRSKRDMRRANHDKVTVPSLIACPHCSEPCVPHRVFSALRMPGTVAAGATPNRTDSALAPWATVEWSDSLR